LTWVIAAAGDRATAEGGELLPRRQLTVSDILQGERAPARRVRDCPASLKSAAICRPLIRTEEKPWP
jgi:hypothetical protein